MVNFYNSGSPFPSFRHRVPVPNKLFFSKTNEISQFYTWGYEEDDALTVPICPAIYDPAPSISTPQKPRAQISNASPTLHKVAPPPSNSPPREKTHSFFLHHLPNTHPERKKRSTNGLLKLRQTQ
jgi:hypothetical protein